MKLNKTLYNCYLSKNNYFNINNRKLAHNDILRCGMFFSFDNGFKLVYKFYVKSRVIDNNIHFTYTEKTYKDGYEEFHILISKTDNIPSGMGEIHFMYYEPNFTNIGIKIS